MRNKEMQTKEEAKKIIAELKSYEAVITTAEQMKGESSENPKL